MKNNKDIGALQEKDAIYGKISGASESQTECTIYDAYCCNS
jgi:hypothetical protein